MKGLRVNWSSINEKANVQADAASKSEETASAPSCATSRDKDRSIGWENLQIKTMQ